MKLSFFIVLIFSVFISCSGSKNLPFDAEPLLKIEGANWIEIFPGQPDGKKSIVLTLPYENALETYMVDSVYFMGYHAGLKKRTVQNKTIYLGEIIRDNGHDIVVPPFEIVENEALISYYTDKGIRRYFKVKNIQKGKSVYLP